MADPRVQRYKAIVADVNEVLYNEWAPIGFIDLLPKDEYERYAVRVVSLLASGAGEDEIAKYLSTAMSVEGNLVSLAAITSVAHKLVSFRAAARAIAL